jgi:WD40 repeat protein
LRSLEQTGDPASSAYHLGKPLRFYAGKMLCYATLSLDGRHLAVPHEPKGESLIFDLQDPSAKPVVLHPHPMVDRIAISPDGHWAATSSWHNSLVKVWDARSGDLERTLPMPARTTAAFSPDGRWLATSTTEYQLWEVGTWQPKGPPVPGLEVAEWNFTAFSPDGRVMARTAEGGSIQLLETSTAKPPDDLGSAGFVRGCKIPIQPRRYPLGGEGRRPAIEALGLAAYPPGIGTNAPRLGHAPYPPVEKGAATGPVTLEVWSGGASDSWSESTNESQQSSTARVP